MVLRIMLLIMGTFLMTYTTSPISLTDGLERLLNWMKKLHVPVHELAMIMSIALRFIPTLIEETDKIMSAQKARGADFESGSIIQKAKALIPILVPLFVSAIRRAEELATAMECRCYHGGEGRTKLHVLQYEGRDYAALALGAVITAGIIALRQSHVTAAGHPDTRPPRVRPRRGADGKGGGGPAEIAVRSAGRRPPVRCCGLLQVQSRSRAGISWGSSGGPWARITVVAVGVEEGLENGCHRDSLLWQFVVSTSVLWYGCGE